MPCSGFILVSSCSREDKNTPLYPGLRIDGRSAKSNFGRYTSVVSWPEPNLVIVLCTLNGKPTLQVICIRNIHYIWRRMSLPSTTIFIKLWSKTVTGREFNAASLVVGRKCVTIVWHNSPVYIRWAGLTVISRVWQARVTLFLVVLEALCILIFNDGHSEIHRRNLRRMRFHRRRYAIKRSSATGYWLPLQCQPHPFRNENSTEGTLEIMRERKN